MALTAAALALSTGSIYPTRVAAQGVTVYYRVNAGGPTISDAPNWASDTITAPSPYSNVSTAASKTGPSYIDLYLRVDPQQATIQPLYAVTSAAVLAAPVSVPASWFRNVASGLAVGIISTSRGPAPPFPATWDFIRAVPVQAPTPASVVYRVNAGGPIVSSTPNWTTDTTSAPSPRVNAAATGNKTFTTNAAINVTRSSLPPGHAGQRVPDGTL